MKAFIQTAPNVDRGEPDSSLYCCHAAEYPSLRSLSVIQVLLFEFENFQGCKAEFSSDCKDVTEKGLEKVGSVIVESGP